MSAASSAESRASALHSAASPNLGPQSTTRPPRYSRILLVLPCVPLLMLALAPTVHSELRATSILMSASISPLAALADLDTNPVVEEEIVFRSLTLTHARLYHPIGVAHPSPLVVIHGVHNLGMDEPRLRRFASAVAGHGYVVLTPQVDELAGYSITRNSAAVIGDAVHELARRSGSPRVGLLGLSFAGGMALIAACEPPVARQLSVVAAIGAHHDLRRVMEFFETGRARAPHGSRVQTPAPH